MENIIIKALYETMDDDSVILDSKTSLIGSDSPIDSMGLVSFCLRLEEISEELGFSFDWSGETMSKSMSMFRSVGDLAQEFERQKNSS